MKFNLEIELDYIDEDGNLDEEIKCAIINDIAKSIIRNYGGDIKDLAIEASQQLKVKSEEKIKELFDNFMEKPVEVSEGWSRSSKYKSATEFLEKTFENAFSLQLCPSDKGESKFYRYCKDKIEFEAKKYLNSTKEELDKIAKVIAQETIEQNPTIAALKTLLDALGK